MSDSSNARANTVMVTLLASLIVPRVQALTGVQLSAGDVAALIAASAALWHAGAAIFTRYFPPPTRLTPPSAPPGS
ncbi:MAG: hypothetical protein ACRETS_03050 [Steroidobacteraceae bacterium]